MRRAILVTKGEGRLASELVAAAPRFPPGDDAHEALPSPGSAANGRQLGRLGGLEGAEAKHRGIQRRVGPAAPCALRIGGATACGPLQQRHGTAAQRFTWATAPLRNSVRSSKGETNPDPSCLAASSCSGMRGEAKFGKLSGANGAWQRPQPHQVDLEGPARVQEVPIVRDVVEELVLWSQGDQQLAAQDGQLPLRLLLCVCKRVARVNAIRCDGATYKAQAP